MTVNLMDTGKPQVYIDIEAESVPYRFSVKLADRTYQMTVKYNEVFDVYTIDLHTPEGEALVYGDPVRYGRPLFGSVEDERFPQPMIIPYCLLGGNIAAVTAENLGKSVRLYLFDRQVA